MNTNRRTPACGRGARKRRGRKVVHAVVGRVGDVRPDMRDAGEMHDRVHAGDERRPVDRARKIGQQRDLDTRRKRAAAGGRAPPRAPDSPASASAAVSGAADEAGRAR